MNRKIAGIGVVLTACAIFYSSSQPYVKQDMRSEISTVFEQIPQCVTKSLEWISFSYAGKMVSIEALGVGGFIEFFIRKFAHNGAFFLLAFFLYCFLINGIEKRWKGRIYSFFLSALYAASDEWHQGITGGRTPLIQDVGIDLFGSLLGIVVGILWMKKWKKIASYSTD